MIGVPLQNRIFLRRLPTDMRKSFDGLSGLVRSEYGHEPTAGDLFVFLNKNRDFVKVLYWDRDGLAIWAKRLERGRFMLPGGDGRELDRTALALLLEGVKAQIIFRSPRWKKMEKPEENRIIHAYKHERPANNNSADSASS